MTTDQIAEHLTDKVLPEYLDSYILVAYTADGEPVIRAKVPNEEMAESINAILLAVLQSGGVPHQ